MNISEVCVSTHSHLLTLPGCEVRGTGGW